jgi:hypothetical protein
MPAVNQIEVRANTIPQDMLVFPKHHQ